MVGNIIPYNIYVLKLQVRGCISYHITTPMAKGRQTITEDYNSHPSLLPFMHFPVSAEC